jgi:2-polyprenyl-3-methyl-5-hydroxy-6-metoxy-1,4-benzoquinol methylase
MTFVQTSPFLGQVFKSNGEVDVVDDMSGCYTLYDMKTCNEKGDVYVQRSVNGQTTILQLEIPFVKMKLAFDEMTIRGNNLGCKCWLGSFANVIWLTQCKEVTTWPTNCQVLELGTGVGVSGITLGKTNTYFDVVVSDGVQMLSAIVNQNIKNNNVKNTFYQTIEWGALKRCKRQFDIIIGCECLYQDCVSDLVETVLHHLKVGGKAYFMNTPQPYRKGVLSFIERLRKHGHVVTHELCLIHNTTNKAPFVLIEFKKDTVVCS